MQAESGNHPRGIYLHDSVPETIKRKASRSSMQLQNYYILLDYRCCIPMLGVAFPTFRCCIHRNATIIGA